MKILFICPTNPKYMPYLDNYLNFLDGNQNEISFLIWDRFNIEYSDENFIFRRGKKKHKRNFFEYYFYSIFIKNHLKKYKYDRIVCFGIQCAFFIKKKLCGEYSKKFILDIRDYNSIRKIYDFKKIVYCSSATVISSKGYTKWLPKDFNYIVNHNFNFKDLNGLHDIHKQKKNTISVSSIGALRDLNINMDFIKSFKNSSNIFLNYHGYGDINNLLIDKTLHFSNVNITGQYNKKEELSLYLNSDLINVLRYPDDINNITALPNRLYLAPYYGRPLFSFKGTYMADLIKEFNLGIVIENFDDIENKILNYLSTFNPEDFDRNRKIFLNKVIVDNLSFKNCINEFVSDI